VKALKKSQYFTKETRNFLTKKITQKTIKHNQNFFGVNIKTM